MRRKGKLLYMLFLMSIISTVFMHSMICAQASAGFSQIKKANEKIKFNGKNYYSMAADDSGWFTDKEITIKSGKFDLLQAFTSAISCNSENIDLDRNNPEVMSNYKLAGDIITMAYSFSSGGKSGINNIKLRLQSNGSEHRMLLMYGTPIEQEYRGETLWLSDILTRANSGSASYVLWAKQDADKMIRKCFSGLKGDGKYNMKITYAKDFGSIPYKYSLVISNDGKMYAYPILHKGTKMEVYYTPEKGKQTFVFDATGLVKSEKMEVEDQIKEDVLNYIQANLVNKKINIKLNKSKATIYESGNNTVQLKAEIRGKKKKVTWKSSDSKIAKVSSKGKVTAKKPGSVIITASVNGETVGCNITVKKVSITLPKTKTMKAGFELTLKAVVTGSKEKVTWKSSNTKIAKVSSKGVVTAKKAGTVTITAKTRKSTAKCEIIVENVAVNKKKQDKIKLDYFNYLAEEEGFELKYAIKDVDGDGIPELITVGGNGNVTTIYRYDASFNSAYGNHTVIMACGDKVYIKKQKYAIEYSAGNKGASYYILDLKTGNILREYSINDGVTYRQVYGGDKEKMGADKWQEELNKYLAGTTCYTSNSKIKFYSNNAVNRKRILSMK